MRIGIAGSFGEGGTAGGIGHVSIGLAYGLSSLQGDDKYLFFVNSEFVPLIEPYIAGNCELITTEREDNENYIRRFARRIPPLRRGWRRLRRMLPPKIPQADAAVVRSGLDLIHFLSQSAFQTNVPSIYHPHDLQHLHYPEHFCKDELHYRTFFYKYFCDQARLVALSSTWTAEDVHRHLNVPWDKLAVVPLAPPLLAYNAPSKACMEAMRHKTQNRDYILYPAQTWPHKNHISLIRALKHLRDRGVVVPLVCSGYQNKYYEVLRAEISRLNMMDQVTFLGFVSDTQMKCLFDLCVFVVIPSKFEAESLPIWEAFAAKKTVAAARVTSLPQQVGQAGLLFDPDDVSQIAECIEILWQDQKQRQFLAQSGFEAVKAFTWEKCALHFRAQYRQILGHPLTVEDQSVLSTLSLV